MALDLSELQGAIFKVERDMRRLRDDVAELRRIADAAAFQSPQAVDLARAGLALPAELRVRRPDEIAGYLRAHPDLKDVIAEMAAALIAEFRGERSEIELVVYQDPEIDERDLTFYVRISEYDDTLMPRIDAVSERFYDRFADTADLVLITTDFGPLQ